MPNEMSTNSDRILIRLVFKVTVLLFVFCMPVWFLPTQRLLAAQTSIQILVFHADFATTVEHINRDALNIPHCKVSVCYMCNGQRIASNVCIVVTLHCCYVEWSSTIKRLNIGISSICHQQF